MIRRWRQADADQVADSWQAASLLAHPFLSDDFLARERVLIRDVWTPNAETWVYEEDGRVVGFISLVENEVGGLFLHPDFHGRGIGKALMDHAAEQHEELILDVFEDNKIGRRFYDRYGFKRIERHFHDETGNWQLRLRYAREQAMETYEKDGIIFIEFSYPPDFEQLKASVREFNNMPGHPRRLWHFKKGLNLTGEEMRNLATLPGLQKDQDRRIAIVVAEDVGFGNARMFTALWESPSSRIAAFRNEEEALEYLNASG